MVYKRGKYSCPCETYILVVKGVGNQKQQVDNILHGKKRFRKIKVGQMGLECGAKETKYTVLNRPVKESTLRR